MWNFSSANTLDYLIVVGTVYAWIIPLALIVYVIVRYRALGIGSQKNLVYSVSIAFLAILYLSVVRRLSGWLEPILPPEATSAILLFVLVTFFEPLQRMASRLLRRRFQEQVDRLRRLGADLQKEALKGELIPSLAATEARIKQEFGLDEVTISLSGVARPTDDSNQQVNAAEKPRPAWAGQPVHLPLGRPGAEIGKLTAVPIGSTISGETMGALEFFAEQLPALIELCRAIEQKVALERELDERERLAMVGQMTASISHNLKNPLGSMKTVLQVQLENPNLPDGTRRDLALVLSELDRLSAKLNQLLRYSRPSVRPGAATVRMNVGAIAEQTVSLLRHEAERRGGKLVLSDLSGGAQVNGVEETLADVISNLVVNAIEAMPKGGSASVDVAREGGDAVISVTDDGPGIPAAMLETIFQPFFTTKPSGTGLGLAIAERRISELGGTIACESPIANGRGARFVVRLPIANAPDPGSE
jgi:signal transduction histidine kinase